MSKLWFKQALVVVVLATSASLAFAIAYCPKPNGIATRDYAFEKLSELRADLGTRFGNAKRILIIASIPDDIQASSQFRSLEMSEATRQLSQKPEFRAAAEEWAKENGVATDNATTAFTRALYKEKANKPQDEIGLLYLFSNNLPTLQRFSPEIAHRHGLVVEGEPKDVDALLTADRSNTKMFQWWSKNLPRDLDLVVFAGFSPSPDVRSLLRRETQVLRVADWNTATENGIRRYRGLMDVPPSEASVLNLLPLAKRETTGWGMADAVAQAYVSNGRKLQSEIEKLGYSAKRPADLSSAEGVMNHLRSEVKKGKKILVYAETTQGADSEPLVRLPGQAGGLTAKDLLMLEDDVLSSILFVSCNSQALSNKLPLTIVGTIYTDVANSLVRQTFAAPQADSMGDYLQASAIRTTSWIEPLARAASSIDQVIRTEPNTSGVRDGQLLFRPVAYVAQVTRPPASTATQAGANSGGGNEVASPRSPTPTGPALFVAGVFGALCREGLRWRRLMEQRRTKAFLRLPYLTLSAALALAAGGVGYLFAQQFSSWTYAAIVAFVAGVGFEKIVELAAELKIWTPDKAVPMGPVPSPSVEQEPHEADFLSYLRHGK